MLLKLAIEILREIIQSPTTLHEARFSPKYFTRNRKLSFQDVLRFLLNPAKECLQTRIENFFEYVTKDEDATMSEQALSKARSHFNHSPFEKMANALISEEYSGRHVMPLWNGFHVFAVDGSEITLPNTKELREQFGVKGSLKDQAAASISILHDVLNGWVVDSLIDRYPINERSAAKTHVDHLCELSLSGKSIVLFDRGYPSRDLVEYLSNTNLFYVFRCQKSWLSAVENAPLGDSIVKVCDTLSARVIKLILPTGEVETLLTNLLDLPESEFKSLYFMRWGIESEFDTIKNKIQFENFSGYSKNAVLQDFWVSITLANIIAIAKNEAGKSLQEKCKGKSNKNPQAPNVSQLVASLKNRFVTVVNLPTAELRDIGLNRLIKRISRAYTSIRKGEDRGHKRKTHAKKRQYPMNKKSNI
jgi:hypothetical protein